MRGPGVQVLEEGRNFVLKSQGMKGCIQKATEGAPWRIPLVAKWRNGGPKLSINVASKRS